MIRLVPVELLPMIAANIIRLAYKYPKAVYQKLPPEKTGNSGCLYNRGKVLNGPKTFGCLVGQAIRMTDKDVYKKIKNNLGAFYSICSYQPNNCWYQFIVSVQTMQDRGEPWGTAVEKALQGKL